MMGTGFDPFPRHGIIGDANVGGGAPSKFDVVEYNRTSGIYR